MIATSNSKVECGKIFSCIILMKAEESSKSLSFLTYEMRMTLVLVALLGSPYPGNQLLVNWGRSFYSKDLPSWMWIWREFLLLMWGLYSYLGNGIEAIRIPFLPSKEGVSTILAFREFRIVQWLIFSELYFHSVRPVPSLNLSRSVPHQFF